MCRSVPGHGDRYRAPGTGPPLGMGIPRQRLLPADGGKPTWSRSHKDASAPSRAQGMARRHAMFARRLPAEPPRGGGINDSLVLSSHSQMYTNFPGSAGVLGDVPAGLAVTVVVREIKASEQRSGSISLLVKTVVISGRVKLPTFRFQGDECRGVCGAGQGQRWCEAGTRRRSPRPQSARPQTARTKYVIVTAPASRHPE